MVHAQPYTHTHRGETATRRRAHLHDNKAYDTVAVARILPQPGLPPVFCSSQGYVCMMMTLCTPLLGSALATLRRMLARETNYVSDDALIKIIHWAGVNSVGRIQDPARHISRNLDDGDGKLWRPLAWCAHRHPCEFTYLLQGGRRGA